MDKEIKFIEYLTSLPESSEKIEMIKYLKKQMKFKNQTLHFKDKMNIIMSFIKFMKTLCVHTNIKIYGSFTRNIIEKIFMDTSEIGYGDPINHDIDMLIYKSKIDFEADVINFSDFISLLRIVSNNNSYDFNFFGFKIADVTETTLKKTDIQEESGLNKTFLLDIPHYVIILVKDDLKIKIDMLCYKNNISTDTWQNEFNINSLSLSEDGIYINKDITYKDSYTMFETINSIINKTPICNLPFNTLLSDFDWKTRNEKVKIVNQIIWFFTNRIKIFSLGYKEIYSDFPFFDYSIEKEEMCQLSGNEPPYIKIKLTCLHYISLMGLAGLVNIRGSEWTEAIKCPLCRHDLMFAMINKMPEKIKIPEQPRKEIVEIDKYEVEHRLFSDENMLYINNLLKNQHLPATQAVTSTRITPELNREDTVDVQERQNQQTSPPARRTQTLVGRPRTHEEYRQLTLN